MFWPNDFTLIGSSGSRSMLVCLEKSMSKMKHYFREDEVHMCDRDIKDLPFNIISPGLNGHQDPSLSSIHLATVYLETHRLLGIIDLKGSIISSRCSGQRGALTNPRVCP